MMNTGGRYMIAVAVSGGVDSSVALELLSREEEPVIGVSHYIWPDSSCCLPEVLGRAEEQCRRMGIPYYKLDMVAEFRSHVVEPFCRSYLEGMTPNPCVLCNREIRFDRFLSLLERRFLEEGILTENEL